MKITTWWRRCRTTKQLRLHNLCFIVLYLYFCCQKISNP